MMARSLPAAAETIGLRRGSVPKRKSSSSRRCQAPWMVVHTNNTNRFQRAANQTRHDGEENAVKWRLVLRLFFPSTPINTTGCFIPDLTSEPTFTVSTSPASCGPFLGAICGKRRESICATVWLTRAIVSCLCYIDQHTFGCKFLGE